MFGRRDGAQNKDQQRKLVSTAADDAFGQIFARNVVNERIDARRIELSILLQRCEYYEAKLKRSSRARHRL